MLAPPHSSANHSTLNHCWSLSERLRVLRSIDANRASGRLLRGRHGDGEMGGPVDVFPVSPSSHLPVPRPPSLLSRPAPKYKSSEPTYNFQALLRLVLSIPSAITKTGRS